MNESRTERHHRRPRSRGGKNNNLNISYLSRSKHKAWHILFGNMDVYSIAVEINKFYLDPNFELVVQEKKHFHNYKNNNGNGHIYNSKVPLVGEVKNDV